jgi:hypothetical protein
MSNRSGKLFAMALAAAALCGCNEQPDASAKPDRKPISATTIAPPDSPKSGIAGDISILLREDRAALDAVIEGLKSRTRVRSGNDSVLLAPKEARNED